MDHGLRHVSRHKTPKNREPEVKEMIPAVEGV